jgi:hypothetical protein
VKVVIDTPGVSVTIEGEGELEHVSKWALELFREAGGWPQPQTGSATGFHTETRYLPDTAPTSMDASARTRR